MFGFIISINEGLVEMKISDWERWARGKEEHELRSIHDALSLLEMDDVIRREFSKVGLFVLKSIIKSELKSRG